tara:strand:+ start:73 stop:210 length:138 start_codon:yes stop_codon:yes gene_type:complete
MTATQKLQQLYAEREKLQNQDLSAAARRRADNTSLWDSFGHDELC